jgi:hypothetical protein
MDLERYRQKRTFERTAFDGRRAGLTNVTECPSTRVATRGRDRLEPLYARVQVVAPHRFIAETG